ncbi:hypothetical protein ZYGR_0P03790 [Zygosaccharomyces rouxii]|uniref:THUMP domain-containing protein n=1 Tax=Zygosaccharomyces rouxii TaxID=4956 RepID=A0A1Q3A275_ZYGRO|nr:hypothetical protein ZYGR_0P03790 [Zygosaccharomyces rouxii]
MSRHYTTKFTIKFKLSTGFLDPGTSGIYATCARKHEKQAAQELSIVFEEKLEEMYGDELKKINEEKNDGEDDDKEVEALSIEDEVKRELSQLNGSKDSSNQGQDRQKEILKFIDLSCECVIFCKTRRPVVPEQFVKSIMEDLADPSDMAKRTRYIQKLTPITYSCSSSMEQLGKLAAKVLQPHFHDPSVTQDYKFAVEVTRRNFNTLERDDIIKKVVSEVLNGSEHNHQIDLKNYNKLILVECFKNNIGMSVVDKDYITKFRKYNVQQIYEKKLKEQNEK